MCSRAKCNIESCCSHVGVSAFSPGLTEAGTTDLNQIRAEWEFTGVQPISLHTQNTIIHKWLCSADCTGIGKQDILEHTAHGFLCKGGGGW